MQSHFSMDHVHSAACFFPRLVGLAGEGRDDLHSSRSPSLGLYSPERRSWTIHSVTKSSPSFAQLLNLEANLAGNGTCTEITEEVRSRKRTRKQIRNEPGGQVYQSEILVYSNGNWLEQKAKEGVYWEDSVTHRNEYYSCPFCDNYTSDTTTEPCCEAYGHTGNFTFIQKLSMG